MPVYKITADIICKDTQTFEVTCDTLEQAKSLLDYKLELIARILATDGSMKLDIQSIIKDPTDWSCRGSVIALSDEEPEYIQPDISQERE